MLKRIGVCMFLGMESVVKERFPKKYRHPQLDEKLSTRRISQVLDSIKCRQRPAVFFVFATDIQLMIFYRVHSLF